MEAPVAKKAFSGGNVTETHDPVAELPVRASRAHGDDVAGNFVPKNLRSRDKPVLDLLDVRAANPACGNTDQDFARSDPRHRNVFHNHAPLAPVHSRSHRGGNGMRRAGRFEPGAGTAHSAAPRPGSTRIIRSPRVP